MKKEKSKNLVVSEENAVEFLSYLNNLINSKTEELIVITSAARLLENLLGIDPEDSDLDCEPAREVEDRWLNTKEVCALLRVTSRTLANYRSEDLLVYRRVGGKFLYRYSDVIEFINA